MTLSLHPVSPNNHPVWVWLATVALAAVLGWLTHAAHIRVPFDSYYYIEFAKQFRSSPPGSFGAAWPFGWPLLGAATGLAGLGAYHGLALLAATGWAGVLALLVRYWPWENTGAVPGALAVAALGTTAAALQFIASVFSEVPFSLALLAFAFSLARWPDNGAITVSCALALLAFSIRYAGAICFPLLGWQLARFHRAGVATRAMWSGVASAGVFAAGLLCWNRLATGHWSGLARGHAEPASAWLGLAADFGWSLPTLLAGIRARNLLGFETGLHLVFGLLVLAGLAAAAVDALRDARRDRQALGAVVLGYAGGMVILRCLGQFDALYNARTALPVLAPLFLLLVPRIPRPALAAVSLAWLALNAAILMRGPNLIASADVRPVLPALRGLAAPEFISGNDEARTLSAHLAIPVRRLASPAMQDLAFYGSAIVLAARPDGAKPAALPPEWRALATQLLAEGSFRVAHDSPGLLLLIRQASAAP